MTRFEFRISPAEKLRIEQAAAIEGISASEFVRRAANDAAREVLQRVTVVPSDYFDKLMATLDEPPELCERIRAAVRQLPSVIGGTR